MAPKIKHKRLAPQIKNKERNMTMSKNLVVPSRRQPITSYFFPKFLQDSEYSGCQILAKYYIVPEISNLVAFFSNAFKLRISFY